MELNAVTAAVGFLLAASAVSMVTIGTINLVKTITAEKEYKGINNKLTDIKGSSANSDLVDLIDRNDKKNKEDQKKQKEKIELINTEDQLKKDIKALQAQIEQAKRDLEPAKNEQTRWENARKTVKQMKRDVDLWLTMNTNTDLQALADASIWSPILGPGGAAIAPTFNVGAGGGLAAQLPAIKNGLANIAGRRAGQPYNVGAFPLVRLIAMLHDQRAVGAGAANLAGAVDDAFVKNFFEDLCQPELTAAQNQVKQFEDDIKDNTAKLREKQAQLEALKKNK